MADYSVTAGVQYNDLKGTSAADWQSSMTDLNDFAKDSGLDLSKYNPIGLVIDLGESDKGEIPRGFVKIISVNTEVVGNSYEEVSSYAQKNGGRLPVAVFNIKSDFFEVLKRVKRFQVVLMSGYTDINSYELASEMDLR